MTAIDLGLVGARVCGFLFYPDGIRIMLIGNAYLASGGTWRVTWPDGATTDFVSDRGMGKDPHTGRLIGALIATTVIAASADAQSVLNVEFDSGLRIRFAPHPDNYEDWDAYSPRGVRTSAMQSEPPVQENAPRPDQIGVLKTDAARAIEPPHEDERLIDLEITDRVYGVTVFAESLQLETRSGDIFFAGPIRLRRPDGGTGSYDPKYAGEDSSTAMTLKLLIDNTITAAALAPDSSRLVVDFADGLQLLWQAPTLQQGLFRARGTNKREFWSKGDGTVYWFGGPEGTHPKFVRGAPTNTD